MKKSMLLMVALVMASVAFTQKLKEKDVPAAVLQTFAKAYPNIVAKWEKEDGHFEASFKKNTLEGSALYDANGALLESEIEIAVDALPAGVADYINKNYAGQKVKEASKIIDGNGAVTYEAALKGKDLIFDAQGKFLKEVKEK